MYFNFEYGVPVRIIIFIIFVALDICRLQNGFHGNLKESVTFLIILVSISLCIFDVNDFYNCGSNYFVSWDRSILSNGMVDFILRNNFSLFIIFSLYLHNGKINTNSKSIIFMEKPNFVFKKMI